MDAPNLEVAVKSVEFLAWILTSAFTVFLCPSGLRWCKIGEIVETTFGKLTALDYRSCFHKRHLRDH